MSHLSLLDALLSLITSSTKVLQCELTKAGLPEPWLDHPQLHPWDVETPTKGYWDARRTLLSSLGTMIALIQNPRERILCEGMGYHHPAVQNFIAHTHIADILAGPDVDESIGLHVNEIARRINVHPAKLERILRFLCMYHIFQETSPNVFANNRCSACFKSGSPNADVPFYWSDISFRAATAFSRTLRNPSTAFSERVQDSSFSAVFGGVKPELDNESGGEIGDFEIVGLHLERDSSLSSESILDPLNATQCCNELESDFEHVSCHPSTAITSSGERPFLSPVLPDASEESSSEEQYSPAFEISRFPLTPDSCISFQFDSPTEDTHSSAFTFMDANFQMSHERSSGDLGSIMTRPAAVEPGSSDYSMSSGVVDSGVFLPATKEKCTRTQANFELPQNRNFAIAGNIPSTTLVTREELELKPCLDEVTTAFSFLAYPQCGLYRKAFAQGMFTLEIMNGALGYSDINWTQWDMKDNVFVELGASTGHLSLSVLPCLNFARFINQDLPEVCKEGVKFFLEKNPDALQSGRVTFQPHDFFTPQPVKGAAVYILSNILHDWPDKEALDILGNISEAMSDESRLLVCEIVQTPVISQSLNPPTDESFSVKGSTEASGKMYTDISPNEAPWPLLKDYGIVNRYSHHQTIELMVLFNGLDRTLAEYCQLFSQRNLEVVKIHRIRKLVSVMELKLKNHVN